MMTPTMTLSLEELQAQPSVLIDLIRQSKSVQLVPDSTNHEQVFVYSQRRYSEETFRIVREAREEYLKLEAQGYSREEAITDFNSAWDAIQKDLAENAK